MSDRPSPEAIQILLQLQQDIRSCDQCDLRRRGGKPLVWSPVLDAKVLIVGISPTVVAENIGEPWRGDIGRKLTSWLSSASLDIRETYFTNAIKCAIRDHHGEFCFPLSGILLPWVEKCRHWLLQEIGVIRPKVVVLLGVAPLYSVTRYDSVSRFQREKQGQLYCGVPCFALHHPSSDTRVGVWEDSIPVRQAAYQLRSFLT